MEKKPQFMFKRVKKKRIVIHDSRGTCSLLHLDFEKKCQKYNTPPF